MKHRVRCTLAGTFFLAAAGTALMVAGGCGSNPFSGQYNLPPTALGEHGPATGDPSHSRVVVVGTFENPRHPSVEWEEIGQGTTEALARTLLNHGRFDVIVNDQLASEVAKLTRLGIDERLPQLDRLRREHPDLRYVVNGTVTDFSHTVDKPDAVVPRTVTGAKRNEAVVAIKLDVFDLDRGRIVAAHHLYGTAGTRDAAVDATYENVSFDSLFFWQSPLGRATDKAVVAAVDVLNRMAPTVDGGIVVTEQVEPKVVRLAAGAEGAFVEGGWLYFYERRDDGTPEGTLIPVLDPVTSKQVRAKVRRTGRISTTAWIVGETPNGIDFASLVLTRNPPGWETGVNDASFASGPAGDP